MAIARTPPRSPPRFATRCAPKASPSSPPPRGCRLDELLAPGRHRAGRDRFRPAPQPRPDRCGGGAGDGPGRRQDAGAGAGTAGRVVHQAALPDGVPADPAGDRPARAARTLGARAGLDHAPALRDRRAPADSLPRRPASRLRAGPDQPGRPSADGASAAVADGRSGRRGASRPLARGQPRAPEGAVRGHRQRRPVLRRGHLHRLRRGLADAGLLRRARHRARTAAHRAVGHPDGDLRLRHPRRAPGATGPAPAARSGGHRRACSHASRCRGQGAMIDLQWIYWLVGGYLLWTALRAARDRGNPRRYANALFWGLVALTMLAAERMPPAVVGAIVVVLACLAASGLGRGHCDEGTPAAREASARRLGNRLFIPALLIPVVAVLVAVPFADIELGGTRVFGAQLTTLVGLGVACVLAVIAALLLTRSTPVAAIEQSRRLLDAIGWAALLPLLLATL